MQKIYSANIKLCTFALYTIVIYGTDIHGMAILKYIYRHTHTYMVQNIYLFHLIIDFNGIKYGNENKT